MARVIDIGPAASEAERLAFDYLAGILPDDFTMFTNPTLVTGTGVARELDAVVVAPHAIFVIEIKSWRGQINGTDHDWYIPERVPSPVLKNRKTAQTLATELRKRTYEASKIWVQGLVFLSHTTKVGPLGRLSQHRVLTRKNILTALTDPDYVRQLSGRRSLGRVSPALESELMGLLHKPARQQRAIQSFDLDEQLEGTDRYAEYLATHRLSGERRLLRVYATPPDASEERQKSLRSRVLWEAQVLRRLGKHEHILDADPPFEDESGLVLPLEHFQGITLAGWVERHRRAMLDKPGSLAAGVGLWKRIVQTLSFAHEQGVIHRLLRPEAILVEDKLEDPDIRVTDFDLAKQIGAGVTVSWTAVPDERRRWSAPEVLHNFSDADHRSDQFSLGALLGFILTGEALFASTADLVREPKLIRRLRDLSVRIPQSVDDATRKMLSVRAADRFPKLHEALRAVEQGVTSSSRLPAVPKPTGDPEDFQPGEPVGDDYRIEGRIGEGGMGVVYAARHKLSGAVHVLKIAKPGFDQALQDEFTALHGLDHPNIVRPITLSTMVPGRVTLVMERAGQQSLAQWMEGHPETADANTLRQMAEDLFAVLTYLESDTNLVHKDIKPDNLLVTASGGLTLIDFSAVNAPENEPFAGTPPYKDPSWKRWSHATDRFAAMICLFELYVGRHPYDHRAPEPDAQVLMEPAEVEPSGLVTFFSQALHPDPSQRPATAVALRQAFLKALGATVSAEEDDLGERQATEEIDASSPLSAVGLSNRAVNQLRRSGIRQVGELLGLSSAQIRAIRAIGKKTANEIITFRDQMLERGLRPARAPLELAEPLFPHLIDDQESLAELELSPSLASRLVEHRYTTVGAIASATRDELLATPGIGDVKLTQILRALHHRANQVLGSSDAPTLQGLWERLVQPLSDRQLYVLDHTVGMTVPPAPTQGAIAKQLGTSQPAVSNALRDAFAAIDPRVLEAPRDYLVQLVEEIGGGVLPAGFVRERLLDRWEGTPAEAEAWIRLTERVAGDRLALLQLDELDHPVLARSILRKKDLSRFVRAAKQQAAGWPLKAPHQSRRVLRDLLPEDKLPGDPLGVAVRLLPELQVTDRGELFEAPVEATRALEHAVQLERPPLSLTRLEECVRESFGDAAHFPHPSELPKLLQTLGMRIVGDQVVDASDGSVTVEVPEADPLPATWAITPGEQVGEMLDEARTSRGFRVLVVPPEQHLPIARSVAQRLGVPLTSFADAWFRQHQDQLDRLEKAERFKAQRAKLARAADATFEELLRTRGRPGEVTVVGDLGILGVLGALDLIRRWYDEVRTGERGFWVLVIPGVIHDRQPFFNGQQQVFHLEGITLPLPTVVPARGAR